MSDSPNPLAPATSPLAEADPNAINELIKNRVNELFNTPPLEKDSEGNYVLSNKDLTIMVGYYRQERHRFELESSQKAAGATGPKKKAPTSVKEALTPADDLL